MRGSELIRIKVLYSPKPEINRRQRNFQSRIILLLQINSKISLYIHPFSFFRFLKFFLTKIPSIARNRIFCWLVFFCLLDITLAVKEYVRRGWTAGFKAKKETLFYLLHRRNQGREPYNLTQTDIFSFLFVKIALIKFFQ